MVLGVLAVCEYIQGGSVITIVITLWVMVDAAIYMENIAFCRRQPDHIDIIAIVLQVYRWRLLCRCQTLVIHPDADQAQSHRDWAS